MVIFQQLFFRRINITGCVIQSLAEQRAGSALRHDKIKNKPRAEQEPRSAHGRAVKNNKVSCVVDCLCDVICATRNFGSGFQLMIPFVVGVRDRMLDAQ